NPLSGDLIGTTRWTRVSLQRLLPDLQLKPGATHLKIRSADQFYEVVALDAIKADERIMLAYKWDGVPLTREHGFPLRIYLPDVHGMNSPSGSNPSKSSTTGSPASGWSAAGTRWRKCMRPR